MKKDVISVFSLLKTLRFPAARLALIFFLDGPPQPASAQEPADPGASVRGEIEHAQKMRRFKDRDIETQRTPSVIPTFKAVDDPSGKIATFLSGGPTFPPLNAFFQNLGTNGRVCFTCHQPQNAWSVSAADVSSRFEDTRGNDPIFRLFDGATCPSDDVSTIDAKREAYKLLIDKGLIRIGLPMPPAANLQFEVTNVDDPYNCTTNPVTGLTSKTTGMVSMYRRPLPSTNLGFLTEIMWDGRETERGLAQQAVDATLGHAQANTEPNSGQQGQIVAFESGIFTAQEFDNNAASLHANYATGGPRALSRQAFLAGTPTVDGTPGIFDLYTPWASLPGTGDVPQARQSVARGQALFNLARPKGQCGGCHNTVDAGDHASPAFFPSLGVAISSGGANPPPALDISGLPQFTVNCTQGPLAGQTFVVTDLGRGMITGLCADIGKTKVPTLRGLAGRAPYFHNGSAATLVDVVSFYDANFGLGFTDQQKEDLVNFLNTL
ncbi:MAG: hypothetical protein M3178_00700 [Pseudomonadota bacterium]|nr:hypothetical protein [Pseudomonadota bacterium]